MEIKDVEIFNRIVAFNRDALEYNNIPQEEIFRLIDEILLKNKVHLLYII